MDFNFGITYLIHSVHCITTITHTTHENSQKKPQKSRIAIDTSHQMKSIIKTRMWANAKSDGRPAKHRWRPLFNAAKFGWRPLLECRAVTLPIETSWNLQGCPKLTKRSQPLVGRFTILWGHVEEILLLNRFFSDCPYVPHLQRCSPTKLCDGDQMATFWRVFGSCISSQPRAACFRPAF